jgi:hypothetical protein
VERVFEAQKKIAEFPEIRESRSAFWRRGSARPRALRGGIDDLYAVRRYIDAWRGIK